MQHVQYLHLMHDRVHIYDQNWHHYVVEKFCFVCKPILNITLVQLHKFIFQYHHIECGVEDHN